MELCKKLNVDNYWAVQTWYKNRRAKWLMENSIVTRNARHNMLDSSRQSSLATENQQSFLINTEIGKQQFSNESSIKNNDSLTDHESAPKIDSTENQPCSLNSQIDKQQSETDSASSSSYALGNFFQQSFNYWFSNTLAQISMVNNSSASSDQAL